MIQVQFQLRDTVSYRAQIHAYIPISGTRLDHGTHYAVTYKLIAVALNLLSHQAELPPPEHKAAEYLRTSSSQVHDHPQYKVFSCRCERVGFWITLGWLFQKSNPTFQKSIIICMIHTMGQSLTTELQQGFYILNSIYSILFIQFIIGEIFTHHSIFIQLI